MPNMRELFEPAKLEMDRAPVLHSIFDRYAAKCSELFADLVFPAFKGALQSLQTAGLRDLLDQHRGGLCALYDADGLEANVLIGFDRRLVFSITDAMFGGDGTEPPFDSSRDFSNLETEAARVLLDASAHELAELFEGVLKMSLRFAGLEPKLDFSGMGLRNSPAMMATVEASINGGGGKIFIIMPQHALMPIRHKLERERQPDPSQSDPHWSRSMMSEISLADVTLTLSMEGPALSLRDVANFRLGDVLRLPATIDSIHELSSDSRPLFRCRLGQSHGQFCVQITEHYDNEKGLTADLTHDRTGTGCGYHSEP